MDHDQGWSDLFEQSRDLHADALRATRAEHAELLETVGDRTSDADRDSRSERVERIDPRRVLGVGAAIGLGAAILLAGEQALGATPSDVQLLRAQQSIEVVAITTYKTALGLAFIGGSTANGVVKAFVTETMHQHTEHNAAFAATIRNLGGQPQTKADPALVKVVNAALPTLTDAGKVVALAIELEQGAAQTYVRNTASFGHAAAKNLTASIMGIEAQHVAVLLAVQALLKANLAADIALPPPSLPAAAGSVGFPDAFYPTSQARPVTEGAS